MVRLLVCGDRQWSDYDLVESILYRINSVSRIECLIEGGQKGADEWAFFAVLKIRPNAQILEFLPDWRKFGKSAGSVRNQQMLDDGKPNLVVAFHDDIERSRGTKDMVDKAIKHRIPVILIKHDKKLKEKEDIELWL